MLSNLLSTLALTSAEPFKSGTIMGLVSLDATLVFQIINTIVIFLVLRHFLFKPVKGMIEKRQDMISDQLEDAKTKNEDAEQLIADYEDKLKKLRKKAEI